MVLMNGYGGHVGTKDGKLITITISQPATADNVWSPTRFEGENYFAKRHYEKVPSKEHQDRIVQQYKGKSMVVITVNTPVTLSYSVTQQRLTTTFYVQRYNRDGFAQCANLQRLMNN